MLKSFISRNKISRNYLITFITEFFVLVAGVIVYKFASNIFSSDGFSQYALCRRTISFILPVLMLGFAVGIPRYIAFENSSTDKLKSNSYLISGLIIIVTFSLASLLLLNLFSSQFSYLFFGDKEFRHLIFPMSVLIFGLVIHAVCYSYFRGKLSMISANVMQMLNQALIPVLVFILKVSVEDILLYTGLASIFISVIFLSSILRGIKWSNDFLFSTGKELLGYGVQRIPGDMALAGFFAMPAFIVAHTADLKTAGYVAFGITLMNIVGAAFGPISLLLLPKSVNYIAEENYTQLKKETSKILVVTLTLTLAGVLIFELFANWIIRIYLGNDSPDLIFIVRIIMFSSVGYAVYVTLRSVLDAYHFRAVNTKNIFISFLIFLVMTFILWQLNANYNSILIAFALSMFILGYMTYSEYKNIFAKKLS